MDYKWNILVLLKYWQKSLEDLENFNVKQGLLL